MFIVSQRSVDGLQKKQENVAVCTLNYTYIGTKENYVLILITAFIMNSA